MQLAWNLDRIKTEYQEGTFRNFASKRDTEILSEYEKLKKANFPVGFCWHFQETFLLTIVQI